MSSIFHRRLALLLALLSLSAPLTLAGPKDGAKDDDKKEGKASASYERAEKLPKYEIVTSELKSVDDAISKMWISHKYPNPGKNVEIVEDLPSVTAKALLDFIGNKGDFKGSKVPNGKKRIYVAYYGVGREDFGDVFEEAKKAGLASAILVTDLNRSRDEGQKDKEFSKAELNNSATAKIIKRLLKAGYDYKNRTFGIFSQPLYTKPAGEPDKVLPIMHLKEAFATVEDENGKEQVVFFSDGTANASEEERYNRQFQITEPVIADIALAHVKELIDVYEKDLPTKEVKDFAPKRINYEDGSTLEVAYSDGKFNPNERIVNLLKAMSINSDGKWELVEIVGSEFVSTYRPVISAIEEAMTKHPKSTGRFIFANQFINNDKWGLGSAVEGYSVYRKFGGTVPGFSQELADRIDARVYQRQLPGRHEEILGGAPVSLHLWHDKTFIIRAKYNGKLVTYVFTGSFNLSSNFRNAEVQYMFRFVEGSPWPKDIIDSIWKTVENEPKYAVSMALGLIKIEIGEFTSHSEFEVTDAVANKFIDSAAAGKFDDLVKILEKQLDADTHIKNRKPDAVLKARIKRFAEALEKQTAKGVTSLTPQLLSDLLYENSTGCDDELKKSKSDGDEGKE